MKKYYRNIIVTEDGTEPIYTWTLKSVTILRKAIEKLGLAFRVPIPTYDAE